MSGHVLLKLLAAAEDFVGRPIGKAVISVPAYFTDEQVRGFGPGQAGQAADLFVSPPASTSRGLTCRPDTLQRRLCRLLLTVCWAGVLACVPRCVLQREATIMAGRIAGLEKIRIIR